LKKQLDRFERSAVNGFHGVGAVVGAEDTAVESAKGAAPRQRFLLEDIEGSGVHMAALEGGNERGFMDEWASANIDDPSAGLQHGESVGVEHMPAGGRKRTGEDYKIGLA
jgi:hypothetical protein